MPGRWENSTRAARLPKDWHKRRAACYRTAGGRCQWTTNGHRYTTVAPLHRTPTLEAGHADHIDPEAGEDGPLQWLCAPHHRAKTTLEGQAARAVLKRPTPRHPGLL